MTRTSSSLLRTALVASAAGALVTLSIGCASDRPITESSLYGCWTPEGAAAPKICFGAADVPNASAGQSSFAWWDNPANAPTYNREFEVEINEQLLVLDLDASAFQRCARIAFEGDTLLLSEFKDADGECNPAVLDATPTVAWNELED